MGWRLLGAGTRGRSGSSRCDVCRTRRAKGTDGCRRPRIVADHPETAILDGIVAAYADTGLLIEAAQQAPDAITDELPLGQAGPASIDTPLRGGHAAISRHLRTFETATMSDTHRAPRIAEFAQHGDELDAHRADLVRQAENAESAQPTIQQLRAVAEQGQQAIDGTNPGATKQVLDELIDRVDISPDTYTQPNFRIPGNAKNPGLERPGVA